MAWINGVEVDQWGVPLPAPLTPLHLTPSEVRLLGRPGRRRRAGPRPLTPDQRAALLAALLADDDIPAGLVPHPIRYATGWSELGPAHLAGQRYRRAPLPMPDDDPG
jgi:hypothetical protein